MGGNNMSLRFHIYSIIAWALFIISFPHIVHAQDSIVNKEKLGLKIGYFGGGTMNINSREYETDAGLCFSGNFDMQVARKFYMGIALDLDQVKIWEESKYLVNLSLITKGEIPISKGALLLRPAIGVGMGMLQKIAWLDNTYYVTLQVFNEFVTVINGKTDLLGDIGLLWELSGGSDIDDITGGPFLMVRIGVSI